MKDTVYDDFIDRLRSESDIVAVVSDYVPLAKKGRNYWGCCPFHREKTPSFSVAPDKGFFYCFGCQAGGNVFNFLMKVENLPFMEAVKLLARKLNIPIPEKTKSEDDLRREQEATQLYKANQLAKDFFHACLTKAAFGSEARQYLASRQITPEIIDQFQLGFAPPFWDKLIRTLADRNVPVDSLIKAGLAISREQGGAYDRFRNRIMYPIIDLHGQVVGFGGRVLDQTQPKYLNSPETPIFNKRHVLYGLNLAARSIKETNQAIIVEGYMDMIACHAAGITNVVASLGTAFTQEQAKSLLRMTKELVFAYDNDAAGQNATLRALSMARSLGASVRVVMLKGGKDPDECIQRNGTDAFVTLIREAPALIDYQIQTALANENLNTLEGKVRAVDKAVTALALSDNAVEVNSYVARLAQTLALDEAAVRSELRKHVRMSQKDKSVNRGQNISTAMMENRSNMATIMAERHIIRLLLDDPELGTELSSHLVDEDLQDPNRREIMNSILLAYNMGKPISTATVGANLSESACAELSSIAVMESDYNDVSRTAADCVRILRLARLKDLYENHRLQADEYERMGDSRFLQELAESQRIKDEIIKLHQ
ncbi:DNA primase [Anaerosporomusa subterranea]|uniref:DNA primase n=1 Tax=Anaerosporomusa subterranea TaxID=1794912 RepID=A0A154BSR4_ANASB|nr:DNA primase [Anaerosporomusa subterranea]KYZ77043.1 DNA primase [Anaerosporomusa subterranea]